jgi:hypothetical protein
MRRRAERTAGPRRGFLLPVVLGLILVAAMLAMHAASGFASAAALSGNRLLQQRAFEAAERGLAAVRARIAAGEPPPEVPVELASDALPSERATVVYRPTARLPLPPGFSSDRFIEERGQLRSTSRLSRGATARLVEGVSRLVPLEPR